MKFKKRYGFLTKLVIIVLVLTLMKYIIEFHTGLAKLQINALFTAFLGGVFFTMGILFAGAAGDFKESEKIPADIAVSIRTMYKDANIIQTDDKETVNDLKKNVKNLLHVINHNFKNNQFKLKEISEAMDLIDKNIETLSKKNVAPAFLTKLRSELTNIDRLTHRVDVISETSFIPAAYTIAQIAIAFILIILMFLNLDNHWLSVIVFSAISTVLLGLFFLVKDMDNPFEYGKESSADVDLTILFKLEENLK